MSTPLRSIPEIIKAAGGAQAISDASSGALTPDAVYKWPRNGIPERHWSLIIPLAAANIAELHEANESVRQEAAS